MLKGAECFSKVTGADAASAGVDVMLIRRVELFALMQSIVKLQVVLVSFRSVAIHCTYCCQSGALPPILPSLLLDFD